MQLRGGKRNWGPGSSGNRPFRASACEDSWEPAPTPPWSPEQALRDSRPQRRRALQEAPSGRTGSSVRLLSLPPSCLSVSAHLTGSLHQGDARYARGWRGGPGKGKGPRCPPAPVLHMLSFTLRGSHGHTLSDVGLPLLSGCSGPAHAPALPRGGRVQAACPVPWRVQTPLRRLQQQGLAQASLLAGWLSGAGTAVWFGVWAPQNLAGLHLLGGPD